MAVGSAQPLAQISTMTISRAKMVADVQGWKPYHLHVPFALKSERINLLEISGPEYKIVLFVYNLQQYFKLIFIWTIYEYLL
jgi:hypothetical protein